MPSTNGPISRSNSRSKELWAWVEWVGQLLTARGIHVIKSGDDQVSSEFVLFHTGILALDLGISSTDGATMCEYFGVCLCISHQSCRLYMRPSGRCWASAQSNRLEFAVLAAGVTWMWCMSESRGGPPGPLRGFGHPPTEPGGTAQSAPCRLQATHDGQRFDGQ